MTSISADSSRRGSSRFDTLPPGISESKFFEFVSRMATDAADTVIITDKSTLKSYRDPFWLASNQDSNECSAVVQPRLVSDLQAIVRLANEYKIPLWTVSRGKNNGYGGPAPRVRGSVVIELLRMNRILEVNDELCTALVEPGVTFFDLYNFCKEKGLKVYPSCPSLGWGSVVGNTLDRGCGYTPLGEHAAAQCGLEVLLPSGELLRTGMGAIDGSSTWQCYRAGYGPSVESLFNQSNFGIVTKMGIWLTPKQRGFMTCSVDVQNEADIIPLVDKLAKLYREEVLQNHPVIGNVIRYLARTAPRSTFYTGDGAIPDEILERIRKEQGLGFWNARFALYGTQRMMQSRWEEIKETFGDLPGAQLTSDIYFGHGPDELLNAEDVPVTEAGGTQIGMPNMLRLQSVKYRGENGGHVSFSPIVPSQGKDVFDFYKISKTRAAEYGYDFHAGIHVFPRYTIHLNLIFFDQDKPSERVSVGNCFKALLADARKSGYSEYRAHIEWMDLISDQYDFNDHALRRFNETIKDAIDPNGILSPGKSGIWPRGLIGGLDGKSRL